MTVPYKLVRTLKDFNDITIYDDREMFCDTETCEDEGKSKGGLYGRVRLFQFYQIGYSEAVLVDCFMVPLDQILKRIINLTLVFHNASYDLNTINCYTDTYWIPKKVDDTLYLSRLKFYDKGTRFGFYECLKYARLEDDFIRSIDKKANQKADWGGLLSENMLQYAAADALYLYLLWESVKDCRDSEVYILDITNLRYAIEYSRRGFNVDQDRAVDLLRNITEKLEKLSKTLTINPNSPKQVCKELNISSSDKNTLSMESAKGNVMAKTILEYRGESKKLSYIHQYNRPILRGFFNPTAAVSGRFSCTGGDRFGYVNMQQLHKKLKSVFCAPDGYKFVYRDYSGVELRMAVCWINDPTMRQLLEDGRDAHSYTASVIYKKDPEDLNFYERLAGKVCNFLLIYGGSAKLLRETLVSWGGVLISMDDANNMKNTWLETFSTFDHWHRLVRRQMSVYGYSDVSTALGRVTRATSPGEALNRPIQGSTAEVIKTSLKMLKERYPDENLVNTIHDSNTLLVPENESEIWVDRLDECMNDAWFYVIKDTAIPDMCMPGVAETGKYWEF